MVALKTIDLCEERCVGLTQSWKKRFLFIHSMALSACPEVLQCSLDGIPLLASQTPALCAINYHAEDAEETLNPPVTVLEHADRIIETAVGLSTYLNRHCIPLLQFLLSL
jgi:hypothetical protein